MVFYRLKLIGVRIMVTIKQIAKLTGVSIATVSYALNNTGNISADTRRRIIEVAKETGYIESTSAYAARVKQYKNIGIVFRIFKGAYYHFMLEGMHQSAASRYKYGVQLIISNKNESKLLEDILNANVDALIILSSVIEDSTIEKLKNRGIPLVFLDREIEDELISSVLTNNVMGITDVMEYLILNGHRRIAFMRGDGLYNDGMRYEAYVSAMKRHCLPIEPSMIMRADFDTVYAEAQLLKAYPNMKCFPDAICCANDEMAKGCVRALESMGFSVPRDVSITGFDDTLRAGDCSVQLTTVRNPIQRIAKEAVEEAMRLIQCGGNGKKIFVETEFIERNSCTIRDLRGVE